MPPRLRCCQAAQAKGCGVGGFGSGFSLGLGFFFWRGGGMAKGGALGPGFRGSGEEWGRGRSPAQPAAAARSPARQRRWLRAALGGWEAVGGTGGDGRTWREGRGGEGLENRPIFL